MAAKGKFQIPSLSQMEKEETGGPKVQSLFEMRKTGGTVQASSRDAASKMNRSYPTSLSNFSAATSSSHANSSLPITGASTKTSSNNSIPSNTETVPVTSADDPKVKGTLPQSTTSASLIQPSSTNQAVSSPVKQATTTSIIVSARQRGNPVLKHIRNVAWEYGDIVPDYQLGQTSCALFLSLRYHQLNPNYIFERLKQLGRSFELRVLLVLVDIKDPHPLLKDLAKMCLLADCVLMLAFNPEEAGRYLETYKSFENKPPDLIMERTEGNLMARLTDTLTKVRSVNKTDVMTLMSAFGSLKDIIEASEEDISLCPGFGPQKAKRLHHVFHEPFLKAKRKAAPEESSSADQKQSSVTPKKSVTLLTDSSPSKQSPKKSKTLP